MSDITFQTQSLHPYQNQTNQSIPYQSLFNSSQIRYQDEILNQYKANLKSSLLSQSLNERNTQPNPIEEQEPESKFNEFSLLIK